MGGLSDTMLRMSLLPLLQQLPLVYPTVGYSVCRVVLGVSGVTMTSCTFPVVVNHGYCLGAQQWFLLMSQCV